MSTVYILLCVYFVAIIVTGYVSSRVKGDKSSHFLIGNRSISGRLVAIGLAMGWVDATMFGFVPSLGFDYGWGALAYIVASVIGFLYLSQYAQKIHDLGATKKMFMMSDFIGHFYSRRTTILSGIVSFTYFWFWKLLQFIIGGQVISAVFGISSLAAACLMGGVVLLYLLLGGFRSQVYTDLFQFILFIGTLALMILFGVPHEGIWLPDLSSITQSNFSALFTLFVLSIASTIAAPDVWQRIFSAKDNIEAKMSMYLSFSILTPIYLLFMSFGLMAKYYNWAADSSNLATVIFTHLVPQWLFPIAVVMFFSVIMSTIATTLFGSGMSLLNDIGWSIFGKKEEKFVQYQRKVMTVLLFVGIALTLLPLDMVTVAFYALSSCLVVMPVLLAIFHKISLREQSVFYGMLVGIMIFITGIIFKFLDGAQALIPVAIEVAVIAVIEMSYKLRTETPSEKS